MCTKCPYRLFYDPENGRVYYLDVNCNKVPLPAGTVVGGIPSLPPVTSVDEWEQAGRPPIETPEAPHTNPLYQTMDNLKCAKATALVEEIWNLLSVYEALRSTDNIVVAVNAIKDALGAFGWVASAPLTFWLTVTRFFTGALFGEVADSLEEVWVNEQAKEELICTLVDRMVTPRRIGLIILDKVTSEDVQAALDAFEEIVPHDDIVRTWIGVFPIKSYLEVVAPKVTTTECGCETYSPTPPPQTEPENGQFGVYAGEVVGDPVGGSSPATVRANAIKQGTKSANLYTSRPGELVDRPLLCIMWEFTEPTEQVSVDILWNVLGGTLSTCLGIQWFWSPNETTQFTSLGFSGAWCEGTNGWPNDAPSGWQLGTAPSGGYWSGNMGFLLARFDIGGTNTAGVTHTIQAQEPTIRGKAVTGGNYRATFQNLPSFKSKTI